MGVAHLARNFVQTLRRNQPELEISDQDVLCLHLAGLVHDLGHGPFSHLFDGRFIKAARDPELPAWHHEQASIGMLDYIIEANNLMSTFERHGLTREDIHFVKELVLGSADDAPPGFSWVGRGRKTFLYDIVANHSNGIDVDKFDYFARDCYTLGIQKTFDAERLIKSARVCLVGDALRVCFEKKEVWNVHELFHTRFSLHKRAYQHRVSTVIENMFTEALLLADPFVEIVAPGSETSFKMSTCIENMGAYASLSDWIVLSIQHSKDRRLAPARDLIHRIRTRDLYRFVGEVIDVSNGLKCKAREAQVTKALVEYANANSFQASDVSGSSPPPSEPVTEADILVCVVDIGYGKGSQNPVDSTHFFASVRSEGGRVDVGLIPSAKVSAMVPQVFQERWVRVWSRDQTKSPIVKAAFAAWCKETLHQDSEVLTPCSSPTKQGPRVVATEEPPKAKRRLT